MTDVVIPNGEFELSCDGWCVVAPSSERIGERDLTPKGFDPSCRLSGRKIFGELLGLTRLDRQRPQHLGLVPRHGRIQPVGKGEVGHPKTPNSTFDDLRRCSLFVLMWRKAQGL